MRVNFSLLEEPIEIEKATFLTIKDVQTFAHLVKLIYQYDGENELKLFDAQQKGLKPTELFVVTDILGYDVGFGRRWHHCAGTFQSSWNQNRNNE